MAGERHGRGMGTAWARHAMCESAFTDLCASRSCHSTFRTAFLLVLDVGNRMHVVHTVSTCTLMHCEWDSAFVCDSVCCSGNVL
jgi:hypothetical protein